MNVANYLDVTKVKILTQRTRTNRGRVVALKSEFLFERCKQTKKKQSHYILHTTNIRYSTQMSSTTTFQIFQDDLDNALSENNTSNSISTINATLSSMQRCPHYPGNLRNYKSEFLPDRIPLTSLENNWWENLNIILYIEYHEYQVKRKSSQNKVNIIKSQKTFKVKNMKFNVENEYI